MSSTILAFPFEFWRILSIVDSELILGERNFGELDLFSSFEESLFEGAFGEKNVH